MPLEDSAEEPWRFADSDLMPARFPRRETPVETRRLWLCLQYWDGDGDRLAVTITLLIRRGPVIGLTENAITIVVEIIT